MFISRILTDLCEIRQNIEIKNSFISIVFSALLVKKVLVEHIKTCLKINVKQNIKLRNGLIK